MPGGRTSRPTGSAGRGQAAKGASLRARLAADAVVPGPSRDDVEDHLAFALETTHTGVWDLDLADRSAFRSREHDRIFGYDELLPEWTYEMFLEHVLPEDRAEVGAAFRHAIATRADWDCECRIRRGDGEVRWIWVAGRNVRDRAGVPRRMAGVVQDITGRKRIEEELGESRAKYQALVETTSDFIWEMDPTGTYTYCGPQMKWLWGLGPDEMLGKTPFDVMPEEERERLLPLFAEIAKTRAPFTLESMGYDAAGSLVRVETRGIPFFHADGTFLGFRGVTRDVTERTEAEQALRVALESETDARQQANDLIKYAPTGIYEIDLRGPRFTSVNDSMTRLSGYSREELLAMDPFEILAEPSRELFLERAAGAMAGEKPDEQVEYRVRRKDGTEIFVVLNVRFRCDENGAPHSAFVIGHDVTERIRAEEERQRLLAAEQRSARLACTLNNINETLLSTLSVEQMLEAVVAGTSEAVGADRAVVGEMDGDEFRILNVAGYPDDLRGKSFPLASFPAVRQAIIRREPAFVENTLLARGANKAFAEEDGDGAFMTLPLIAGDRVIGGLSYVYDAPRHFDEQDVEFAQRLSVALSLALENARHFELERNIADRLQEALLALPDKVRGVEFAHAYHSATEAARVGGDFYDLFEIDDSHVGMVIGDVAGKGLDAAVLTSMVKNTIRAHANEQGKTPAQILDLTNDVVYKATPTEAFVTVFFGLLDRRDGRLVYANAGHTAAALAGAEGGIAKLAVTGPLLGAFSDVRFEQGEARVGHSGLVFLYTDGLTEARREGELYGEQRLFDFLASLGARPASDVVSNVIEDVIAFTGNRLRDDVALLALKRTENCADAPGQRRVEM